MSIARKVFFVAASFALPIIVLAFLVVRSINEHIAFAEQELAGTAYQRPLEALLRDIQDHQRLARSGPAGAGKAEALAGTIRQELLALRAADRRAGARLQFTGEGLAKRGRQLATAENLQRGWERLEALRGRGRESETDAQYDRLTGSIQTMITHVGDMSNLILDPELDTFHLITDTLVLLPRTQARLGRLVGMGRGVLTERADLAVQAAFLESERDQIKGHLDTSLSENKNEFHGVSESFQKNVPVAYEEYAAAVDRFISLARRAADAGGRSVPADEFAAAGARAREESFRLWDAAMPELDRLLQARIDYYAKRKVVALLLSGAALLLACLLAYRIASSLIDPLNKLSRALTPGADLLDRSVQKLAEFNEKGAHDLRLMRITCDELDAHAESMRKAARELARVVFGTADGPRS